MNLTASLRFVVRKRSMSHECELALRKLRGLNCEASPAGFIQDVARKVDHLLWHARAGDTFVDLASSRTS